MKSSSELNSFLAIFFLTTSALREDENSFISYQRSQLFMDGSTVYIVRVKMLVTRLGMVSFFVSRRFQVSFLLDRRRL